jgi:putative transposase
VPARLDVHLILDNYATHKHPAVRAWLAKRSRYHLHFTPTYSSWLNQVEIWFGLITRQAIRRGSFRTVHALIQRITSYVRRYNRTSRPFVWTASAESILAKLTRLARAVAGTQR